MKGREERRWGTEIEARYREKSPVWKVDHRVGFVQLGAPHPPLCLRSQRREAPFHPQTPPLLTCSSCCGTCCSCPGPSGTLGRWRRRRRSGCPRPSTPTQRKGKKAAPPRCPQAHGRARLEIPSPALSRGREPPDRAIPKGSTSWASRWGVLGTTGMAWASGLKDPRWRLVGRCHRTK